jgi:hypothetical protein
MALIGGLPRQSSGYQFIRATGGWGCRPVRLHRPAAAFALDRDVPSTSLPIMRRR